MSPECSTNQNATMKTERGDKVVEESKDIDDVREQLIKILVEDYDASPHLAEEAALKVNQDDVDAYETIEDLAEYVHDTQEFWD